MSGLLANFPPLAYASRANCITGYGAAARHQIWALRKHGLRLKIVDAGSSGDPDPHRQSELVQSCRQSDPGTEQTRGTIVHLGPNMAQEWIRRAPRPHILVFVWETNRLPAAWVRIANDVDQVWCATQWQADTCLISGVSPGKIKHVPFALDPQHYPAEGSTLAELEGLRAQGYFVFGSMFQWTERKCPRAMIGGFLAAFQKGERVALVLKSYEGDDASTHVASKVQEIVASYQPIGPLPRIQIVTRRLNHDETLGFYRGLDCYVSTHRGEGWGLGIHESLLLGRRVIATDWSAPAEYAAGCYHPVNYTLEAPHSMGWQPFYTLDQEWAVPDIGSVSAWMREVHDGKAGEFPREAVAAKLHSLHERAGQAASRALGELFR